MIPIPNFPPRKNEVDLKKVGILRDFYTKCELYLPPNPKFRAFVMKLQDGKWLSIPDKVNNTETLRKYLVKYTPQDVYYSTSEFLQPAYRKKLSPRHYNFPYCILHSGIFLKSNFLVDTEVDIDKNKVPSPEDMENLRQNIIRIYEYMKATGCEDFIFTRTGRGIQMLCTDWHDKFIKKIFDNPLQRENYTYQIKRKYVWEMKSKGCKLIGCCSDSVAMKNDGVGRLWGTVHRNGTLCKPISDIYNTKNTTFPVYIFENTNSFK